MKDRPVAHDWKFGLKYALKHLINQPINHSTNNAAKARQQQ